MQLGNFLQFPRIELDLSIYIKKPSMISTFLEVPIKVTVDTAVALIALSVSIVAVLYSVHFWRLQFRPIVTAAVRTAKGDDTEIKYKLEILNSGSIPAKNIALSVDQASLPAALGADATEEHKTLWLACFSQDLKIRVLHNQSRVTCSFGTTRANDQGFWKYRAKVHITITYQGWFGKRYVEEQTIEIVDSASFTGYMWGDGDA